ncbi:MAG: hypothetical protein JOS17DRAFT_795403 [Linnemannia elongata]|nr:MAG: hypothetical protein JOS17DRAFT_795403 [Linnemannia elongata]
MVRTALERPWHADHNHLVYDGHQDTGGAGKALKADKLDDVIMPGGGRSAYQEKCSHAPPSTNQVPFIINYKDSDSTVHQDRGSRQPWLQDRGAPPRSLLLPTAMMSVASSTKRDATPSKIPPAMATRSWSPTAIPPSPYRDDVGSIINQKGCNSTQDRTTSLAHEIPEAPRILSSLPR